MTQTTPDYILPSEISSRHSSVSVPVPAARNNRPAVPRNAVMTRTHPPLYAGDYNNNLSRDMYWWEKLDRDDPEEKRVLEAMYYGEERQPRCNVCERQNRACMWFLGEEDQSSKSCVKCRRVHATCKTIGSLDTTIDDTDDQSCIEVHKSTYAGKNFSQKRKASGFDRGEETEVRAKRTRSSLSARRSDRRTEFETLFHAGSSWVDPDLKLDEETQADVHIVHSPATKYRHGRKLSMTIGRDEYTPKAMARGQDQYRPPRQPSQDGTAPALNQIERALSAFIDDRYMTEVQNLKTAIKAQATDHQIQITALRSTIRDLSQNGGGGGFEDQMKEMETQIEDERASRLRLEDENMRLKNRMSRLEARQMAGINDLQDQIRRFRGDQIIN